MKLSKDLLETFGGSANIDVSSCLPKRANQVGSVRPKFGIGIGNQNQGWILVSEP